MQKPPTLDALITAGAGLFMVAGAAAIARVEFPLSAWYPLKAAALFAVMMAFVAASLRTNHPFARFGLANRLTTARGGIVALVAGLVGEGGSARLATAAALASGAALIMDGLDGQAARRTRTASPFGARFDMELDALLIQALSVLAWQYQKAGWWVLFSGLMRYLFLAAGQIWPWLKGNLPPSFRGRLICVVQTGGLLVAIIPAVTPPYSTAIAALALAALSYSFLVDTLRLRRQAAR